MSFLSKKLDEWYRKYIEDGEDGHRISHSPGYHQFFQGYSEEKRLNPDERGYRIERTYTGYYLALKADDRQWKLRKLLYPLLLLAAATAGGATLFLGAACTAAAWVAVFGVLQLVTHLLLLIPVGNYAVSPRRMKLGEFHISAERLEHFAGPSFGFACAYLAALVAWHFVFAVLPDGKGTATLLLQALSATAMGTLFFTERNARYERIANETQTPENANEIW